MDNKSIIISIMIIIFILFLIVILNCLTTVPTGFVGVKTRFGKVQDEVIQEGLNTKAPFIEKIVKIDCKTKKIEAESEGSTKDMQTVNIAIAINYNVDKNKANILYREVGKEYEDIIIKPALLEAIKSSMAQYTAEELITKRPELSNNIEKTVVEKIAERGFVVTEFNVTNIDFSEQYDQAIEAKAVKQQEVSTAQAELEKQKIQNQKEIEIAEKDARVMELQNSQITENTLKLRIIEKWNGVLPQTTLGQGVSSVFNVN